MEIRGNNKHISKLKKLYTAYNAKYNVTITFTIDKQVQVPFMIVKQTTGTLTEYIRGFKELKSLLKHGYNRIQKNCPYQLGKCRCEKCQLYLIQNGTGDCIHNWQFFKESM